ncbi:copper resistance protein B [Dasania marina]|uniref:copper resistance protein B n=1 Tax=Dasania marina TaxID=471499 RepID=UPI0030D8FC51
MKNMMRTVMKHTHSCSVITCTLLAVLGLAQPVQAGGKDDPLLSKVMIDQLELRDVDGSNPLVLEGQAWLGKDLQKLWIKADVERVAGETEELELQALYSQAIAPYWDLQVGLRQDSKPTPSRSWAVIGLQGLAPYFFEVDSALFIGESGRTALRLQVEYELLLTQRLILSPELEANFYGQNDSDLGIGSGLSDVQAGLRLRYEIRREFAPYIGINWQKSYGNSASYARKAGHDVQDTQWVVGIRAWF